jgi:hypothetical protein
LDIEPEDWQFFVPGEHAYTVRPDADSTAQTVRLDCLQNGTWRVAASR